MLVLSSKKDVKRESNLRSAIYFIIALSALLIPVLIWGDVN